MAATARVLLEHWPALRSLTINRRRPEKLGGLPRFHPGTAKKQSTESIRLGSDGEEKPAVCFTESSPLTMQLRNTRDARLRRGVSERGEDFPPTLSAIGQPFSMKTRRTIIAWKPVCSRGRGVQSPGPRLPRSAPCWPEPQRPAPAPSQALGLDPAQPSWSLWPLGRGIRSGIETSDERCALANGMRAHPLGEGADLVRKVSRGG